MTRGNKAGEQIVFNPGDGGADDKPADSGAGARQVLQMHSENLRIETLGGVKPAVATAETLDITPVKTSNADSRVMRLRRHLEPRRDSSKGVDQLVKEGVFKDARQMTLSFNDEGEGETEVVTQTVAARQDGSPDNRADDPSKAKPPEIVVGFSKQNEDPNKKTKPNFVVKQDGTVEVHNDPEKNPGQPIIVEVERKAGSNEQTKEQEESVKKLVSYLDERVKKLYPQAQKDGVVVRDEQGLVPQQTEVDLKTRQAPEFNGMSDQTRQTVERTNRLRGTGSGSMNMEQADQYVPRRDRQEGETDQVASLKDMIKAIFNPDRESPYTTVRKGGDGGYRVGQYGLSYGLFYDWLSGFEEDIGDPPDPRKVKKLMAKLAKQGKVPNDFADKFEQDPAFAQKFCDFMGKMKSGNGEISAQEMKDFLPQQLQETIATDLTERYAAKSGGDAGLVSLAFHTGKPLDQLTKEDRDSAAGQQIIDSGRKLNEIARQKQNAKEGDTIEWTESGSGATSKFAAKLVRAAHSADAEYNRNGVGRSGGQCAAAVQVAFQKAGWSEFLGSGDAWNMRGPMERSGKFARVASPQDAREGDIILWRPALGGSTYGHIEIVTKKDANGLVATSDFTHRVTPQQFASNKGGYYSGYVILRPKDKGTMV